MNWAAAADLTNRVVRDTFGVAVTYRPAAGGSSSITAVLDERFERVELQGEQYVSGTGPRLAVRLADLAAAPKQGDAFDVGARTFEVVDVQTDGQGGADLFCVEAR